ncbi:ParB-like nuclease domain protein [Gordonia phage MagicMan]|nr:ParB-like nuclease domain protein [Gordonia phage MagicMan]
MSTNPIQQVDLKPSQLVPHASNIRSEVGDITGLTASIVAQGVLQPLTVVPNGKPDRYVIIAGHRRHAAATAGKLETVPCVVRHDLTDEADQIAAMIAENVERADLTPVEEARGVMALFDLGESPNSIAARTGMSIKRIRVRKKIGNLSDEVKARITEHKLSLDDAAFIADHAGNPADLSELESALGTRNWSVAKQKQLERVADRKRVAAIRKEAETAGIEIVTGWDTRRALNASALDKLGVSSSALVTNEYTWPVAPEVLEAAQSGDTVAYLHIATSQSLVVNGKWVSEALVVLSAPTPEDDDVDPEGTPTAAGESSTGTPSDPAPAAQTAETQSEPSPETIAARERLEALRVATKVRRDFIKTVIARGDMAHARLAGQCGPKAGDYVEICFDALLPYLPIEDPHPEDVRQFGGQVQQDRSAAVVDWFDRTPNPNSLLLGYAWLWLDLADRVYESGDYSEVSEVAVAGRYAELLEVCGYTLSDIEIEARDAIKAALDEESNDEG